MMRRHFLSGASASLLLGGCSTLHGARPRNHAGATAELRAALRPEGGVPEMVRFATLAPNGHNTQPWRFSSEGEVLSIESDLSRRTPVVDPDDHHVFVSLGAAAENLAIAGLATGHRGEPEIRPDGVVAYRWRKGAPLEHALVETIPARQSTRSEFVGGAVPPETLKRLEAVAREEGVRLVILTDRPRLASLRDLVLTGSDAQMDDPAFIAELKEWMRFNEASAVSAGDGLYSAASGNPTAPDLVGSMLFEAFFRKSSERENYARQMNSSSGAAIFLSERYDRPHWVRVGRAAQRFLLEATRQGLATSFVNQPVETTGLRGALAALAGEPDLQPDLVIRFGYAPRLPYSLRRPVSDVLTVS